MCDFGGIIGSLLGGALDAAFPEFGIPLSLATGAGGFLGDVVTGKDIGSSLLTGLTSGAGTGLSSVVSGGDFFAGPTDFGGGGGLFGGGGAGISATDSINGTGGLFGAEGVGSSALPATSANFSGAVTPTAGSAVPATTAPPAAGSATGGADISSITGSTGSGGPIDLTGVTGNQFTSGGDPLAVFNGAPSVGGVSPATSTAGGSGGFLGKIGDYIKNNPMQLLSAGGGLLSLLMGNKDPAALSSLNSQALLDRTRGNQYADALATGRLPAGAQAAIDQAAQAARATTRSNFASLGLTGSTPEAQALSGIDLGKAAQAYKELLSTSQLGENILGQSDNLYRTILQTQLSQDAAAQQAIARIAAALAGSGSRSSSAATA